nr:MAG TPA: hypothetical protein [Caudoviricetes sp.]
MHMSAELQYFYLRISCKTHNKCYKTYQQLFAFLYQSTSLISSMMAFCF